MDIEHHTDLAEMQYRLDRYGAGCYWQLTTKNDPHNPITAEYLSALRRSAKHAGCSDEQILDAEQYATSCALRGTRPLRAGTSITEFLDPTHTR